MHLNYANISVTAFAVCTRPQKIELIFESGLLFASHHLPLCYVSKHGSIAIAPPQICSVASRLVRPGLLFLPTKLNLRCNTQYSRCLDRPEAKI